MTNRIQLLQHKGCNVLYIDFSGLKAKEVPAVLEDVKQYYAEQPENSILALSNFENTGFNSEIIGFFSSLRKDFERFEKGSAVIGIKGLQKIAYDTVMKLSKAKVPLFDNKNDALDWLSSR